MNRFGLLVALLFTSLLAPSHAAQGTQPSQETDKKQSTAGPQAGGTQNAADNSAKGSATEEPREGTTKPAGDPPKAETKDKEGAHPKTEPLITNDAVICGILLVMLGLIFWTASSNVPVFKRFYHFVPMLLLCYFLPSLLTLGGIVDPEASKLYFVASRYMLPTCLVLLTLSIDLREILKLGPKALIMFFTGTLGVVIGGPIAVLVVGLVNPEIVGGADQEAVWRGLSTVAGSWIGGGANQAAMKEIFQPSDGLYSVMVAVDVIVAEVWMIFLLLGVGKAQQIDELFRADSSAVQALQEKMEKYSLQSARIPTATDLMVILAVGFGVTGLCHFAADLIAPAIKKHAPHLNRFSLDSQFFWLIVLATTLGIILSFTRARKLEGAGASKIGAIFIYFLVATIGMNMDLLAVMSHPGLFLVGGIWMAIHVVLLLVVGYAIRSPYFFLAVGSKANIGGAASAPVVAAAFHPSLAPVGVLLAVLGYALGTYGAWLCAIMMRAVSTG